MVLGKGSAFGTDGDGGGGDDGGSGGDGDGGDGDGTDGGGDGGELAHGVGDGVDICQRVHRQSFPYRPSGAVEGTVPPNSLQESARPHVSAQVPMTHRHHLRSRHCPELRRLNFRLLELRKAQFVISNHGSWHHLPMQPQKDKAKWRCGRAPLQKES